jgi:hypothetical protein
MDNFIFKIAIVLIFYLFANSCKKHEDSWPLPNNWKGKQDYGSLKANRNGELWEASGFVISFDISDTILTLLFETYDPVDSFKVESIGFINVPLRIGKYPVYDDSENQDSIISTYTIWSYDLIYGIYDPDLTKQNYIVIEDIDTTTNRVKGWFDVFYKMVKKHEEGNQYPRNVNISEAHFDVRLR